MSILLALALALIVLLALVFSARRGRQRAGRTGPTCGGCGYSVVGLTNMTCPECGGDLRRVGILTPDTPDRHPGALGGIIGFTALMLFIAVVASVAMTASLPLYHSVSEQVRLTMPRSGAYREVVLHADGGSYRTRRTGLPINIDLTPNVSTAPGAATSWIRSRPDGGYEYATPGSPRVTRPGGFGSAAVLEWLKASGIDVSAPPVAQEASRIVGEARALNRNSRRAMARLNQGGSSSGSSGSDGGAFGSYNYSQHANAQQASWAAPALVLFWISIWICGVVYLARRWRYDRHA